MAPHFRFLKSFLFCAAALCIAVPASANVIFDESVDGDVSSDGAAPTELVLAPGSNIVNGRVSNDGDIREFMTFTIEEGFTLAAVSQLAWSDVGTGAPGNTGYYALNEGATSEDPSTANGAFFLGGDHLNFIFEGADLLAPIEDGGLTSNFGATGFTLPLGPGDYTFLVQQTGPQLIAWSIDFQVVPEPSTALLVGVGIVVMGSRRSRRAL